MNLGSRRGIGAIACLLLLAGGRPAQGAVYEPNNIGAPPNGMQVPRQTNGDSRSFYTAGDTVFGPSRTWVFSNGTFTDNDANARLRIAGAANSVNNGDHEIDRRSSATVVITTGGSPADETFGAAVSASVVRTAQRGNNDRVDGTTRTWTLRNGSFTANDVGSLLRVSGSQRNNGDYHIVSYTNGTTVVTDGAPINETFQAGMRADIIRDIVHTGAGDSVNASDRTWIFANGAFSNNDVGRTLRVDGLQSSANNAEHLITQVLNSTTVVTHTTTTPVTESIASRLTITVLREMSLNIFFREQGEDIDWLADAFTEPATFSPMCSFTGTLMRRDAGCRMDFGWYNADPANPTRPDDDHIYPLVPADANVGDTFTASTIRSDPNYLGGQIGFAIKRDPAAGAYCPATHFSERRYQTECNDTAVCNPAGRWINALIYQSKKYANAYYMGWEDLPTTSSKFGPEGGGINDGDFNDKLFLITGITCTGGGTPCSTGLSGVCESGVYQCDKGTLKCKQRVSSSAEVCDGLDNDCDGVVDEGTNLCGANRVCDRGVCVPYCIEQGCPIGQVCTAAGLCSSPGCETMSCPDGQRCLVSNGSAHCGDPCSMLSCPYGQECRGGSCVDKCAGVTCDSEYVCTDGVCQVDCRCKGCPSGYACRSDGQCVFAACRSVTCPAGRHCDATGSCMDNCAGAVCPTGQACQNGQCVDPCLGKPPCSAGQVCCPAGQSCAGTCVSNCDSRVITCPVGLTCSNGTCVDSCLTITCGAGQFCHRGACVDVCQTMTCPSGEVCSGGVCQDACVGVSCGGGQKCIGGTCVDACTNVTCPPNETCKGGACVDACAGVACESGQRCVGGACQDPCQAVTCPTDQTCIGGGCVDRCAKVSCPLDQKCQAGACVDACKDVTCPSGNVCVLGSCGNACTGVQCPLGEICHAGSCIDACRDVVCEAGKKCVSGVCIDACQGVSCAAGLVCKTGVCEDACQGVACPATMKCANGGCVDRCTGVTCGAGELCSGGVCRNACQGSSCPGGQKCSGGVCVDACWGVTCSAGRTCVEGSCTGNADGGDEDAGGPNDGGVDVPGDAAPSDGAPSDAAQGDLPADHAGDASPIDAAPQDGVGTDTNVTHDAATTDSGVSSGTAGCSCQTGMPSAPASFLLLAVYSVLAILLRRRR